MPIGKWENIRIEGDQLLADAVFDMDDDLGKKVAGKVEKGFLKAASIGVEIIEVSNDPLYIMPGQSRATVTRGDIFEASIVDIGSNRNAVKLRSHKAALTLSGSCDPQIINSLLPQIESEMKAIALKLGLPEQATEAQIMTAIDGISAKAAKSVPALLALGRAKGVITAANEKVYEQLAASNFDSTLQLIESTVIPAAAPAATPASAGTAAPAEKQESIRDLLMELRSDKKAEPGREAWTLTDWRKNDPDGLAKLQVEKPAEFDKLMAPLRKVS